jgi:hypothetical protein
MKKTISNGLAMLVIGAAFGWLIGMAVSPVINTVLTSLVALLVTLAAVLAGIKSDKSETEGKDTRAAVLAQLLRQRVSAWPIALLLISTVFGAGAGLYLRTHGCLIPRQVNEEDRIKNEIAMWRNQGIDSAYAVNTVYCAYYGLPMQVYMDASSSPVADLPTTEPATTHGDPPHQSNANRQEPVVVTPAHTEPAQPATSDNNDGGIKPNNRPRIVFPHHAPPIGTHPKNDSME